MDKSMGTRNMFSFSKKERRIFSRLNTPKKIQKFTDRLPYNLEEKGDTYYSPRKVLREKKTKAKFEKS